MSRSALFGRLRNLFARALAERPARPHDGPSRRAVMTGLTAALSAPTLATTGCKPGTGDGRVAIVGGGIAGIHTAYRLNQAGVTCDVYESSARFGGRMYTGTGLFANGHLCELGGELIDSNHATLWDLSEELGIAIDDRQSGPYAGLRVDTWWLDGAEVPDDVLLEQLRAVVDDLVADYDAAETDDDAYLALDLETLADWLDRRIPPGQFPELNGVLDIAYRGEFGLENDQQSALNLIYLLGLDTDAFRIFGASDERFHTHAGNSAFVDAMVETLPEASLHRERRLASASGKGPYTLSFDGPDGAVDVEVDIVVFALPYSTLRDCDLTELKLSDDKREIIADLGYGTNAKVMAGFTSPYWRDTYQASGSVTADLPFQQSWDTSLGQEGPGAILTNFLGGEQGTASAAGDAETWVEDVLLPGLDAVFPGVSEAWTGEAVRMHWPTEPNTKGSYTCYLPGQWEWWSTEGDQEGNLHFCGEHTSADFQGWMEGGAESGGRVAAEVLGDLGVALPAGLARLQRLRSALPPSPGRGANAIRLLRQRRRVYRAWAELHGR
ncbi:MAG: NAD(P)/FAD-dependent oxidoreductase [Myxococcota bacterium]